MKRLIREVPMRQAVRSLLLLVLLIGVIGASVPEREGPSREDILRANQEKLDSWKQDPQHHARLQRDLDRFWEMSHEQRTRLRQLDQELHQQDSLTQQRLWGALERYHAWLERLPETERRRIESVPGEERLAVIREVKELEWIRRLPAPQRDRVLALRGKEREAEIVRLREEQRQRQQEPAKPPQPRPRKPSRLSELPSEVQSVVEKTLSPRLKPGERERLTRAQGTWPGYLRTLMSLASKHKVPLPGLDAPGPQELWEGIRGALPEVPDRTLHHFLMNEMSPEDRQKLPLLSGDPAIREKVKREYFKKHPRELRRLQQLDRTALGMQD